MPPLTSGKGKSKFRACNNGLLFQRLLLDEILCLPLSISNFGKSFSEFKGISGPSALVPKATTAILSSNKFACKIHLQLDALLTKVVHDQYETS